MIAEMCLSTLKRECLQLNKKLNRSLLKTAIQLLLDTHPFSSIENALLPIFVKLVRLIESGRIQDRDHRASVELIFATRREQMRIVEERLRLRTSGDIYHSSLVSFSVGVGLAQPLARRGSDHQKRWFGAALPWPYR